MFLLALLTWSMLPLAALSSALPNPKEHRSPQNEDTNAAVAKRAGAFSWRAIPPTCGIVNPAYCNGPPSTCTAVQNSTQYLVQESTQNASVVWNYFLPMNDYPAVALDYTTLLTRCAEACYGYGNPGDCQSFYIAWNASSPKQPIYGNIGGDPRVPCLLFNRQLVLSDLYVRNVTYRQNSTAGNIVCDGTQAQNVGAMIQLGNFATGPAPASIASSTSVSYSLTVGGFTSTVPVPSSSVSVSVSSSSLIMSSSSMSIMSVSSSVGSSSTLVTTSSMVTSSSGM